MSKAAALTGGTKPAPSIEMDTAPRRQWLTEAEVKAIIKACENERDRLMILVGYRHGLRVSELIALTWRQVDLDAARLRVRSERRAARTAFIRCRAARSGRCAACVGARWSAYPGYS